MKHTAWHQIRSDEETRNIAQNLPYYATKAHNWDGKVVIARSIVGVLAALQHGWITRLN